MTEEVVLPEPLGQTRPEVRYPEVLRRPWRCPVCRGSGDVEEALYTRVRGTSVTSVKYAQCRACEGVGIVWG